MISCWGAAGMEDIMNWYYVKNLHFWFSNTLNPQNISFNKCTTETAPPSTTWYSRPLFHTFMLLAAVALNWWVIYKKQWHGELITRLHLNHSYQTWRWISSERFNQGLSQSSIDTRLRLPLHSGKVPARLFEFMRKKSQTNICMRTVPRYKSRA